MATTPSTSLGASPDSLSSRSASAWAAVGLADPALQDRILCLRAYAGRVDGAAAHREGHQPQGRADVRADGSRAFHRLQRPVVAAEGARHPAEPSVFAAYIVVRRDRDRDVGGVQQRVAD